MHLWGLFIAAMLNTNVDLGTAWLRPKEEEKKQRLYDIFSSWILAIY